MKKYININPIKALDMNMNELEVDVRYCKGGYNMKRGIYAWMQPVQRHANSVSCVLVGCNPFESGTNVFIKELTRGNKKVEEAMANLIQTKENMERLAECWNKRDLDAVRNTILEIAR